MTDFGGDALIACMHMSSDRKPAAMAGADDDAENRVRILARAVDGFGNRKAIGIIGKPHVAAERCLKIAPERLAVQEHGIGIAHDAGARIGASGNTDADRPLFACRLLGRRDKFLHGTDTGIIAAGRRGDAVTGSRRAIAIERDDFHFRAAPINSNEHVRITFHAARCHAPRRPGIPVPPPLLNIGKPSGASPPAAKLPRKSSSDKADAKPHRKTLGFGAELL